MAQHHKKSVRKGAAGERELVATLNANGHDAKKISVRGITGPDVEAFGRTIEVKRYEWPVSRKIPKWLEDAQMVAHRWDRGRWVLFMYLEEFLDLLDEAKGCQCGDTAASD